jgi:hypothetical protein
MRFQKLSYLASNFPYPHSENRLSPAPQRGLAPKGRRAISADRTPPRHRAVRSRIERLPLLAR